MFAQPDWALALYNHFPLHLDPPLINVCVGSEFADYGMEGMSRVKSFGSFKREFKLDDVCDFVKTGVQVCMVVKISSKQQSSRVSMLTSCLIRRGPHRVEIPWWLSW
jgi:hypothetical protein